MQWERKLTLPLNLSCSEQKINKINWTVWWQGLNLNNVHINVNNIFALLNWTKKEVAEEDWINGNFGPLQSPENI